ncbi:hypothetical protein BY458DRAFT_428722 [Sporodiniella umbellata]|nr:hypothetical protein BY458DRAFT_428722 [Sporodiniella umbellata]
MESLILQKLLSQSIYRLGKRGKWYERLALVQMTYLGKNDVKATREQRKCALETCIKALHDTTVHQKQHDFSYMRLKKPKEINVYGERLSEEITGKKSVWRTNNGAECSVEQVALEYYSLKGFKGLHAENGIVRTIASLLFWDIIFASIPGVFETPYQKAPLDLRSDAFYESINWNYELQDILEIAECIGSSSLASLCQLLFQEYSQRQSGIPDLCCWNYEKKECLFSEESLTRFGIQVEVCYVKLWKGDDILLEQ